MKPIRISAAIAATLIIGCTPTEPPAAVEDAPDTVPIAPIEASEQMEYPEQVALPLVARGQEPGWMVRVEEDGIELKAYYATETVRFPYQPPHVTASAITWSSEADGRQFELTLRPGICRDTMTGMPYPHSASYRLDGTVYHGCGGEARPLLVEPSWNIVRIGDQPTVGDRNPTIDFDDEDNRFAGLAGCNRYMGGFSLSGEGLSLEPAASTLMACPDESVAEQERRLLDLLARVYRFDISDEGQLILHTPDASIVADPE